MTTIGGAGIGLPNGQGLSVSSTGQQQGLTNQVTLGAGEVFIIPSGTWMIQPGPYTFVQQKDPITGMWRNRPSGGPYNKFIESDGVNYRLANTTGCAIGAVITTNGGANATNGIGAAATGLTVTANTGGSVWVPVVGGAVATTVVSAAAGSVGSGYTYPPIMLIDQPPAGGLPASGHVSALSSGTVTAANCTIDNQGAGYTTAPNVTFVNDPRDTTGAGAAMTVTLTGTSSLTGLYVSDHGSAVTSVATLTFSTGTAAATAIMNFTVTSFTTGTTGSGYAVAPLLISSANIVTATPVWTNPQFEKQLTIPRPARILTALTGTGLTFTGAVVEDGGLGIQAVPTLNIVGQGSTGATITAVVGGVTDTSLIMAT